MSGATVNLATAPLDRTAWFGHLTLENADAVVERLRRMLEGKYYTFVAVNEAHSDPDVRCSNRLTRPIRVSKSTSEDGNRPAVHITMADGRYVWGLHSTSLDQRAAYAVQSAALGRPKDERSPEVSAYKDLVFLSFSHDYSGEQLRIEHHAPAGDHLTWVVQIEDHDGGDS